MATPNVRVTDMVCWFPNATPDSRPIPAYVYDVHPGGMLALSVIMKNTIVFHQSSWHKDAQILKDNPKVASRGGMWMTADEYYGQKTASAQSAATPPFDATNQDGAAKGSTKGAGKMALV